MTQDEILQETQKCMASPYYFATTYLKVKSKDGVATPFTTLYSEQEFNDMARRMYKRNIRLRGKI